jgi:hypothetical protein
MKKLMIFVVGMVMACLLACGGSSVEGTYYNVDSADEFIELKNNGEFYLKAGGLDFSGKYVVEGKTIVLNPKTALAAVGTIDNGLIIDKDGTRWQKK